MVLGLWQTALIGITGLVGIVSRQFCQHQDVTMSSVAEIESAIGRLSSAEVAELAAWLEEYQQMINASAEIFSLYDKEESE